MTRSLVAIVAVVCGLHGLGDARKLAPPPEPPPPTIELRIVRATAHAKTSLSGKAVANKIARTYGAAIKRCYRRVLSATPTAAGTATFRFTVNPVGKVAAATAQTFDRGFTRCVQPQLRRWRFAIPQSPYAEPTSAKFTIGLRLSVAPPVVEDAPG